MPDMVAGTVVAEIATEQHQAVPLWVAQVDANEGSAPPPTPPATHSSPRLSLRASSAARAEAWALV
jgi:hypothetical protein